MAKGKSSKNIQKNAKKTVTKSTGSNNTVVYFLLGVICVMFIYLCFETKFIQDDAYITFRYVENFVNGDGLVFNIGERVEGYTNFLWLMVLSLFAVLGMDMINISQMLSVAFGVVTLIVTYKISSLIVLNEPEVRKKGTEAPAEGPAVNLLNLIPVILTAFVGAFQYWSVSGMETSMFVSFSLLGIYYYIKNKNSEEVDYKFPLFLFLASITRPEGLYIFAIIILHKVIMSLKDNWDNKGEAVKGLFTRNNVITYFVYLAPTFLFILFRLTYYGYPFPNTYYAKTGFSAVYLQTGLDYFWTFAEAYLLYGFVFIIPVILFKKKEIFFETLLLFMMYVLYTIYIISVGGDVLPLFRFFFMVGPLVFILFGKVMMVFYFYLKKNVTSNNPTVSAAIVLLLVCGLAYMDYNGMKEKIKSTTDLENGLVDKMRISGEWFKKKQQEKGAPMTIAATTIGAVSYYAGSQVSVVDMLGLTDEEIAHNPVAIPEISEGAVGWKERNYNIDYIMSRKPDYIYFSTGIKPSAYAERGLFTSPEFLKYYYPTFFSEKELNFTDIAYKRKSDAEVQADTNNYTGNPNYKKSFINSYTGGMNLSRDKTRLQEAINTFQKAIDEGPTNFAAPYQSIGEVYMRMGNKEKALEFFEKAVGINDYSVLAHYYLYNIYGEAGNMEKANIHLEKIRKYSPDML